MHIVTIFPLGNADCTRIDLQGGKKILFDYANMRDPEDKDDKRCDLEKELRDDLDAAGRDSYDVVAFTHLDEDHYKRSTEFFWLDHASKYQGDDRIKIDTMWVPAVLITETSLDKPEARVLQKESRHRFKKGKGIRVFSRPEKLRKWCEDNDVDFDARKHLITDAGQIAPEFDKYVDGVEFFIHSPFAKRLDKTNVEDRNQDSLVLHATFLDGGVETRLFLMADAPHDALSDIVDITKARKRTECLDWDLVKLPHHSSYRSLGPEKGDDKTEPVAPVRALYEEHRLDGGIIVSTSWPIPAKGSKEDKNTDPPHRQAANYYKNDVVDDPAAEFLVTMEQPNKTAPKPIEIEIDSSKATVRKRAAIAGAAAYASRTPRAG